MARVNITVPDGLVEQARAAGLNVSRLASRALAEELDRLARIAELDAYLAELDAELGPVPPAEVAAAAAWADRVLHPGVLVHAGPVEPVSAPGVTAAGKVISGGRSPRPAQPGTGR